MPEDTLLPILVDSAGRSGTTLLMQLLGRDPTCFFNRVPPYEIRYLTYICKLASMWERQDPLGAAKGDNYAYWTVPEIGITPWGLRGLGVDQLAGFPQSKDVLSTLWKLMAESCRHQQPGCRYYAEKTPYWVVPMIRRITPYFSINLFRDPRDVYLSSNAKNKKAGTLEFGRRANDDDFLYAINLARTILTHYENSIAGRGRLDTFVLRYEDLIQDSEGALSDVREKIGLDMSGSLDFSVAEGHRTAVSVKDSVGRFQQEDFDPLIRDCLENLLQEMMLELGYLKEPTQAVGQNKLEFNQVLIDRCRVVEDGSLAATGNGHATVTLKGDDFHIILPVSPMDAERIREIWICVAGRAGSRCSIYWRRSDQDFNAERGIHVSYHPAEHFEIISFDVFEHPLWKGTIDELRLDLFKKPHAIEPADPLYIRWMQFVEDRPKRG